MSLGADLAFLYRAWRYRLKVEPAEIAAVRQLLGPGQWAIDVGAHKGAFSYWMRRAVGDTGRVFAFEPQPALAEALAARAHSFGWSNVTVERAALSAELGRGKLFVPNGRPAPGASLQPKDGAVAIDVELSTLDRYFAGQDGPIALIKCDAEGHELEVFQGGAALLARHQPALLFECEARHRTGSLEEVFEYLRRFGYRGEFLFGGERLPLDAFRLEVHQDPARLPYANNFLFLAR